MKNINQKKIVAQVKAIDQDLNSAYETNNPDLIAKFLLEDWCILEQSVGLISKEEFLGAISSKKLIHTYMGKEIVRITLYNNLAIVVSRGKNIGLYLNEPFGVEQWVTNTYVQVGKSWKCIMTHETPVSC